MKKVTKERAFEKCKKLQRQIKLNEENNLDEEKLIKLRKEYDFYYKILIDRSVQDGKETNFI